MFLLCWATLRCRARAVPAVLAFLFTISLPGLSAAAEPDYAVIGNWKFTSLLQPIDITSLDERGAKKLLGQIMSIRKDGTRFDNYKCAAANFEAKRVEPNLYVQNEAGISASKLHLPNPVTVVDINCTEVFLRKGSRAVIFWKGWFFEAKKVS